MFFSKKLQKFENLKHCFFSRKNGFSKGHYASLNCGLGSGDKKQNVLKNLNLVSQKIGCKDELLITLNQTHSNKVVYFENESSIKKIKSYNKKAGVSLNPETSIEKVLPVLNLIDLVLVMSVNPGFGGQKFMSETLEKVKILRKEIDTKKLKAQIEIDGGINFENSKIAIKAGVDILVSGTTIFKENGGNLKKNIQLLRTG